MGFSVAQWDPNQKLDATLHPARVSSLCQLLLASPEPRRPAGGHRRPAAADLHAAGAAQGAPSAHGRASRAAQLCTFVRPLAASPELRSQWPLSVALTTSTVTPRPALGSASCVDGETKGGLVRLVLLIPFPPSTETLQGETLATWLWSPWQLHSIRTACRASLCLNKQQHRRVHTVLGCPSVTHVPHRRAQDCCPGPSGASCSAM